MARAAAPARRKRAPAARRRPPPRVGWWGRGAPPWERWPGVTIQLDAVKRNGRWETEDGRYYFDAAAARRIAEFFPDCLTHHKGEFAGLPFELLPYQELLIVLPLFGWKHAAGPLKGLRRFRKVLLAVPKGNGKSPLGAGIGLALVFVDDEQGAEVYSAAADRDQATIVFDTARIMVENDPVLAERSNVLRRVIEVPDTHSYYKVLSADAKTKHGPNIHGLIFDEFHAQPSRELFETLYRGTVKRRQPVVFMVTTAGDDDESICAEEWEYARKVQSGTITDDTYLPVIFEASKDDDWKDPELWKRVNPGYGITVKADAIANEAIAAQNEPRKLNDFLRYHTNRWVNQATAWIPIDWWDACKTSIDEAQLVALACGAGLDLAQKYDLASFSVAFSRPLEGPAQVLEVKAEEAEGVIVPRTISLNVELTLFSWFWIPEDTAAERAKQDRVPYLQWEKDGLITFTEGNVIDYDRILADIVALGDRFPLLKESEIGYDPAFATDLALKLQARGFRMVEVLQNYRNLSEPSQILEALIKAKRVRHSGHRVLRWNWENVSIRTDDAGRIRPVKPRRAAKRIDGVVSSIMATSRVLLQPQLEESVYESRGLFVV